MKFASIGSRLRYLNISVIISFRAFSPLMNEEVEPWISERPITALSGNGAHCLSQNAIEISVEPFRNTIADRFELSSDLSPETKSN